ncbi:MAG: 30S ribosomal protein S20 [Dehalococcoidia bacterium]
MANSVQARKRVRQNIQHAEQNKPFRSRAARLLRDARVAIRTNSDDAPTLVREAQSALDRAARRNIIHPNAASRRKSRLAQQLKAAQAA